MKKCFYLLSLLSTAIVFNACSDNDDVVADNGSNGIVDGMAYMRVTISQPSGTTRAAADGGYADAEAGKGYDVKTAKFLFFNADDSYLTEGKEVENAGQGSDDNSTNNIESYVSTTVVLGPTTLKPNTNIKMLTFLNFQNDTTWENMKGKKLSEVLNMTDNANNRVGDSLYVMTTSAYVNSKGVVQATEVPADSFKTSESAVTSSGGVSVFVERTVAKVKMNVTNNTASNETDISYNKPYQVGNDYIFLLQDTSAKTPTTALFTVDGDRDTLAVKITGWKVNAVNTKGYIVKHINNSTYKYIVCESSTPKDTIGEKNVTTSWNINCPDSSPNYYWNDSTDHRSFWAEDVNYASGSQKISTVTGDGFKREGSDTLTYFSISDVNNNKNAEYVYENTIDQDVAKFRGGQDANVTTMLVVGQIGKWNSAASTPFESLGDLYRVDGAFYTPKTIVTKLLNETYCTHDASRNETDLEESNIKLTATPKTYDTDASSLDKIREVTLTAKPNGKFMVYKRASANNNDTSSVDTIDTMPSIFSKANTIWYYNSGYCFYQVPIEHPVYGSPSTSNGTPTDATIYGVVRNHSYELTLNSVSKLGSPVNDLNTPITPIPGEDTYYYLGTKLNVLAWRKATQQVNL